MKEKKEKSPEDYLIILIHIEELNLCLIIIHINYLNNKNERYSEIQSILSDNIREILLNENEIDRKIYAKKVLKKVVSTLMGFIPILSNAKVIVEAIIGKDLNTDKELSIFDRSYSGISSLPVILYLGKIGLLKF